MVNGSIIRIINQIEMEEAVMQENASRFSLVCSLPVFSKEIITDLGSLGLSEASQNLIYRNIPISTMDPQLNSFLPLLYQPSPAPIDTHITIERWNNYWKRSREKTALSYSSLYFSHCKVQSTSVGLSTVK